MQVALLLLSFECRVTVTVMKLFLTVPWVGLQFVIVVFSNHSHLLLTNFILYVWEQETLRQYCTNSHVRLSLSPAQ